MTNRITSPGVTLELDGQPYNFRLDFTAMADFEQATGRGVLELFGEIFGALQGAGEQAMMGAVLGGLSLKASDLQALTWACVGGEDSGLSLRDAGRLIHAGNVREILAALTETLRQALPEAGAEGKQSHPPLPGPDGSPSGASAGSPSD